VGVLDVRGGEVIERTVVHQIVRALRAWWFDELILPDAVVDMGNRHRCPVCERDR
jgi:hypothetical protein